LRDIVTTQVRDIHISSARVSRSRDLCSHPICKILNGLSLTSVATFSGLHILKDFMDIILFACFPLSRKCICGFPARFSRKSFNSDGAFPTRLISQQCIIRCEVTCSFCEDRGIDVVCIKRYLHRTRMTESRDYMRMPTVSVTLSPRCADTARQLGPYPDIHSQYWKSIIYVI